MKKTKISQSFRLTRVTAFMTLPLLLLVAGCGTFQLSSGAIPLTPKSQQQMQLDSLMCKDQAKLEASSAERQAGAFALGLTIVGVPLAHELEKSKQREVYKTCMETRGYRVLPPNDQANTSTAVSPTSPAVSPPPSNARQSDTSPPVVAAPVPQIQPTALPRDEATQLQKLKELRDRNLITAEEYETKRKVILDKL